MQALFDGYVLALGQGGLGADAVCVCALLEVLKRRLVGWGKVLDMVWAGNRLGHLGVRPKKIS